MQRNGMSYSEAGKLGAQASTIRAAKLKQGNIDSYNQNPKHCLECGAVIDYEHRNNTYCSNSCAAKYTNRERAKDIQARYRASLAHGGDGSQFMCRNCGKILPSLDVKYCCDVCTKEAAARRQQNQATKKRTIPKKRYTTGEKEIQYCGWCGDAVVGKGSKKYCSLACAAKHKWAQIKASIIETGLFPADPSNETNRKIVRHYLEDEYGHVCAMCGRTEWNGQPILLIVDHIDGDSTNHSVDNFRLICPNCDSTTDTYKYKHSHRSTREWRKKYIKHVGDAGATEEDATLEK